MLPNMRLSGTANDPLGDFLAVSSASVARSAANAASVAAASNSAASFAAASRSFAASVSSSAWGPLPVSTSSGSASFASTVGSGPQSRTLLNNYKESTGWSRPETSSTSMPWAAAVKAPIEQPHHHHHHHHHHNNLQQQQHALLQQQQHPVALATAAASLASVNAFGDSNNTMGSWTSPETSSSTRSGWNADGSMKSDGTPDDGTSIWGNPTTKKTGIDWTEKESLLNPPQTNNSSEKRTPKSESIISSINGTEAWGAPVLGNGGGASSNNISSNRGSKNDNNQSNNNNSQQLAKLIENSGNNFVGKLSTVNNEPLSWGESSSLQKVTKNGNSSPTSDSVWNYLTSNNDANVKRKTSTDWLSSAGVSTSNSQNCIDELNKQLEATSLFNGGTPSVASIMTKKSSSSIGNNPNLDNNGRQSSLLGGANSAGTIGTSLIGSGIGGVTSNAINDLKQQMSANYSAPGDLIELSSSSSPMRQPQVNMLSPNNQTQSQLGAYSLGVTPSRELLKQMVHQIQLAVQAGHLNAHILNQPLSTPTLQLVYTLLQQIKLLQQYQEIQQRAQTVNKSSDIGYNVAQQSNLELQITRVQQNISLLQKAITQQQAALTENDSLVESNLKQQQQQAAKSSTYNDSYANISKNDFTKQPTFTNSIMGDWSRPSVNEQSNQFNNALLSESCSAAKAWRGVLSSEGRDNNAWLLGPTSSKAPGARPAPPPGLINNLGPSFGNSSVNEISSILDSDGNKQAGNSETQPMTSRESSSSLWSGAWFD